MKKYRETLSEPNKRILPTSSVGHTMHIYDLNEFRRILERERARADRSAKEFSLVVFDMSVLGRADYKFMTRLLQKRTRLTDILGWLDANHLAVMLFETALAGAKAFAASVTGSLGHNFNSSYVRIYIHPTDMSVTEKAYRPAVQDALNSVSKETPLTLAATEIPEPVEERETVRADATSRQFGVHENSLLPILSRPVPRWKRIMDVMFAGTILLLLSPLFVMIGLLIYTVSPGPIFFKQTRIGQAGRPFTFWKFRTMKIQAETQSHQEHVSDLMKQDIPMAKLDLANDPRIIPLGKFMRASCIDELPQLFNVLSGDMSIVGPRPCLPYEAIHYRPWQSERFLVLPGMTGSWQVNGKNKMTFKEMIRLDISYARRMSMWSDIKILFKTMPAILELVRDDRAKNQTPSMTKAL
jgi:lipopolysaccharide/colanic/teichoic acid biosynthesis glycosyltransferase